MLRINNAATVVMDVCYLGDICITLPAGTACRIQLPDSLLDFETLGLSSQVACVRCIARVERQDKWSPYLLCIDALVISQPAVGKLADTFREVLHAYACGVCQVQP